MRILVFTEGTIITHQKWAGLSRQEVIRWIQSGEAPDFAAIMPIGEAAAKLC